MAILNPLHLHHQIQPTLLHFALWKLTWMELISHQWAGRGHLEALAGDQRLGGETGWSSHSPFFLCALSSTEGFSFSATALSVMAFFQGSGSSSLPWSFRSRRGDIFPMSLVQKCLTIPYWLAPLTLPLLFQMISSWIFPPLECTICFLPGLWLVHQPK